MMFGLGACPSIEAPTLGGYQDLPMGIRETYVFPMINIIGTHEINGHPIITIIGGPAATVHPTTQIIGQPEPIQISSTQEIISQQTLDEAEQHLNQIIEKASQLDLSRINEKIKIVADAIKEWYERNQN